MFDVPVVQIRQRSSQLEYEITGGDEQAIGEAVQVAGPAPRKGVMSMFGSGLGDARVVVQVRDPHGQPLCYVDYQPHCPVAIVRADGSLLGRYDDDWAGLTRDGVAEHAGAGVRIPMCHRLIDPVDEPVCRLVWKQKRVNQTQTPVSCRFTDLEDARIAQLDYGQRTRKDRYRLEFDRPLPEPLRTLVIASPLAFDLRRS